MAQKSITNRAPAPRGINLRVGDKSEQRVIAPGETVDGDPIEDEVFKALVKAGELVVGKAGERPASPEEAAASAADQAEAEALAREAAAYKRGFEDGRGKAKDAPAPDYVRA